MMWTKTKAGFRWVFGTNKGRAYSNGLCSLLWCFSAYNVADTSNTVAGLYAFLAALFGAVAGQNASKHFWSQMVSAHRNISDTSLEIIRDMRVKLNEKEDEIEELRQELERTYS